MSASVPTTVRRVTGGATCAGSLELLSFIHMEAPIKKAVEIAGSVSKLARLLGVTPVGYGG
jgi:hypothetical protein